MDLSAFAESQDLRGNSDWSRLRPAVIEIVRSQLALYSGDRGERQIDGARIRVTARGGNVVGNFLG